MLSVFLPGRAFVPPAAAQSPSDLSRARDHVDFAEYQEALAILTPLIESGNLSGTALRDAYILKARSHVGLGQNAQARAAFCSALKVDPDWEPDEVVYTQDEIAVFNAARQECTQTAMVEPAPAAAATGGTPWYAKPVTWVVGGVVLIGGILLASGGGGGDETPPDQPIGDPPPPPPVKK
jgi:hypothetical protein